MTKQPEFKSNTPRTDATCDICKEVKQFYGAKAVSFFKGTYNISFGTHAVKRNEQDIIDEKEISKELPITPEELRK